MKNMPLEDTVALIWFFCAWAGYSWLADTPRYMKDSLLGRTAHFRHYWVHEMTQRENRIMDVNIVSTLMQSTAFMASTTIFIVAGLLAILSAQDTVLAILKNIPFAVKTSPFLFNVKILTLIVVFIYAFFKHTWSMRQLNYTAILIGATPYGEKINEKNAMIERLFHLSSMSGKHFNRGMRAYYFGLAALSWFIHPYWFMGLTFWTVLVLYRREFLSKLVRLLGLSS